VRSTSLVIIVIMAVMMLVLSIARWIWSEVKHEVITEGISYIEIRFHPI
jgi:hypothetical protein